MQPDESERPVAIRRWADACFHLVDEVVEEGYIIGSVLIPKDEVLEVRHLDLDDAGRPIAPACAPRAHTLRIPPKA